MTSAKTSGAVTFTIGSLLFSLGCVGVCAAGVYYRNEHCDENVALGLELCLASSCCAVFIVCLDMVASCIIGWGEKNDTFDKIMQVIALPISLYGCAAFIYLCVQVFSTSPGDATCFPVLWKLGLAYCVIGFAAFGLIIILVPFVCCCVCAFAASQA